MKNQRRKEGLFLAIIAIIITLAIIFLLAHSNSMRKVISELQAENTCKSDSIRDLTALMSHKLKFYCDTMTVAEKIKQIKLNDYSEQVRKELEKEKEFYLSEKSRANDEALSKKQAESNGSFSKYFFQKAKKLRELAKENPEVFKRYAVSEFWGQYSYYNRKSGNRSYEEKTEVEKIPLIKKFIKWDTAEYKKHQEFDKGCQVRYEATMKSNETKCNTMVSTADVDYRKLIAQKKAELGL